MPGFSTYEAVVTYPFHPLAGQTVLVIGDYEHDGIRHFLIGSRLAEHIRFPIGCSARAARSKLCPLLVFR